MQKPCSCFVDLLLSVVVVVVGKERPELFAPSHSGNFFLSFLNLEIILRKINKNWVAECKHSGKGNKRPGDTVTSLTCTHTNTLPFCIMHWHNNKQPQSPLSTLCTPSDWHDARAHTKPTRLLIFSLRTFFRSVKSYLLSYHVCVRVRICACVCMCVCENVATEHSLTRSKPLPTPDFLSV